MLGGIYSNQRCPICGGNFKDDGKRGLFCSKHPECQASKFFVRFTGVFKRFINYQSAQRFLTGLRYEFDKGSFDERDYRKDNPLGFENLAFQWLELRKENMLSIKSSIYHMGYAIDNFGNRNIKEIRYAELEDFFHHLKKETDLSDKTRFNIKTTLHSFWTWAVKRNRDKAHPIAMPDFPEIKFKLAYRQTVTLDIQDRIIEEVKRIAQRREWVAIRILSTYPKIRPGELWKVKEKDIDLDWGIIRIQHPKSNDPNSYKEVKLLDEDVELIKSLPKGFPEQYFLRHDEGKHIGQRYGINYLNRVWKKACHKLGISGVSLYPGTKHSTVRAMRKYFRPDEIKKGTGINSNKAFERYFMTEYEDELKLYRKRSELRKSPAPNLHQIAPHKNKGKLSEN
ncbi:MAG: hypothetical protein V1930_05450 [Pseudomonadota bacterium]